MTETNASLFSLALGPEMTIAQAADVHGLLLETVGRLDGGLSLDLSAVSDFDSTGIQLLLAAHKTLQERGAVLRLHEPSQVVLAALRCYGLAADLQPQGRAAASEG
ncbi:anti-anti-sigma factor [Paucibacter oligotrophus]|uniref:Anti-anti-sigma factor n=1 Tax=Roseateles oligotrophus TaxID=1769250 RepID=A0A840LD18_9BURK|nr:STAS domain-containing protein [Roseateles oligotrophus]MBB4844805.1 anti-anti-sigma factor [Roseateles oligotrophus]